MKTPYLIWSSILISSLTLNGLAARSLAIKGLPYYDSLSSRGLFCLLLVFIFSRHKKLTLIPKSIKNQIFRACIAGLALSLFTLSYKWLSASTVAVLSNVDVPLLVLLGSSVGIRSSFKIKILSLTSILLLVFYMRGLEQQSDLYLGLMSLGSGCLLLCFGYYFIKRSMEEENEAITILTPALAVLVFGLLQRALTKESSVSWNTFMVFESFLAGVGMFGAYYATMRLYEITDIATAEFPTLISSIVIQPLEAMFLHSSIQTPYLLSSVVFVGIVYYILRLENHSDSIALPDVPQKLDFTCGAACFESMYQYFFKESKGELYFAEKLQTLKLGYTPFENIVPLAETYGLHAESKENAELCDLRNAFKNKAVIFVTWWDEDAGHYSLVKSIDRNHITLMDPWTARGSMENKLDLTVFIPNWKLRGSKAIFVNSPLNTFR